MELKKNKTLIYTFTFTYKFVLYLSILPLIYIREGITIPQVSLITIVGHLSIFLLEIPTGVFADKIGKRRSVLLGIIIDILSIVFIIFSRKIFVNFIIWMIIQALGITLISGADSAMIFEYLKKNSSEEDYHRVTSNMSFLARTSSFLATIICGKIIEISFNATLLMTLSFKIIALIMMCMFKESGVGESVICKKTEKKNDGYYHTIIMSAQYLIKNRTLLYYSCISIFLLNAAGVMWEYRSLVVDEKLKYGVAIVSIVVSVLNMVLAFSFLLSKKCKIILEKDNKYMSYLLIPLMVVLVSVLPGVSAVAAFVVFIVVYAVLMPYINYKLNESIKVDNYRATILSILSAFNGVIYAVAVGFFGFLNTFISLEQSFIIMGIIYFVLYWGIYFVESNIGKTA